MEIQWADPSPEALFRAENHGGKYIEFALALRAHQGKWAVLPAADGSDAERTKGSAQNQAAQIRSGKTKGFTKGEYEAIADDTTGKVLLHVRYLGPVAPKEPTGDDASKGGGSNGSDDDPPSDPPSPDDVDPKKVRKWARENGWPELSDRGRLGGEIMTGYLAARANGLDDDDED